MKILLACECSGRVRQALAARGHEVYSIDLDPSEDNSPNHIVGDVLEYLRDHARYFDMMIGHPPCTYLANSGVRWLYREEPCYASHESTQYDDVKKVVDPKRWRQMLEGARFFAQLLDQPIPKIAVENPVMHQYAKDAIQRAAQRWTGAHFVQPWWFGDKAFKATGFSLKGLPPLREDPNTTLRAIVPKKGTPEHKQWSIIHQMSPGKNRAKDRSRTFPGIARAIAEQWT